MLTAQQIEVLKKKIADLKQKEAEINESEEKLWIVIEDLEPNLERDVLSIRYARELREVRNQIWSLGRIISGEILLEDKDHLLMKAELLSKMSERVRRHMIQEIRDTGEKLAAITEAKKILGIC